MANAVNGGGDANPNTMEGGAAEIQAMLSEAAKKMGVDLSDSENPPLQELMEAAVGILPGRSMAPALKGQKATGEQTSCRGRNRSRGTPLTTSKRTRARPVQNYAE